MTQLLMANPVSPSATACNSTSIEAIELPRYRTRQSKSPGAAAEAEAEATDRTPPSPDRPTLFNNNNLPVTTSLLPHPILKTLIFTRPLFFSDITISTSTTSSHPSVATPVYHAHTSEYNLWQPDVILYTGGEAVKRNEIAVARFRWTRDARMGFGRNCLDDTAADTQWEDLRNTSNWLAHYQYDLELEGSGGRGRRKLRWVRTHDAADGVDGWSGWISLRNYRLVDLDGGEVVGVFLADNLRSLTKKGELRLFERLAKEVEVAVVLSMCVISEKATRRGRVQKSGGCGE